MYEYDGVEVVARSCGMLEKMMGGAESCDHISGDQGDPIPLATVSE